MDQRTRAAKLVNLLAASYGSILFDRSQRAVTNYIGKKYKSFWKPAAAMPRRRTYKNRMRRSAGRRGRARRVRKALIAGRGPYQKRGRRVAGRRLNTKMTRNDYDSTREIVSKSVIFPESSAVKTSNSNCAVGDFPLAVSKMFDYDEYKLSNIQLVLTPLNVGIANQTLSLADAGEPYIYIVPRIHPDSWTSTPTLNTIKSTPGVMRFHMLRSKPIVVNLKPIVPQEDTVFASTSGATYTIETPYKRLGWIHQPQSAGPVVDANYPNLGTVTYYLPQLAAGSFQPKWRLDYYATVSLRGNRALAEV